MIIVFDTNIWLANLYLRTPAAAAARFFISQNKASVALPEVVRLEVQHHLREHLQTCILQIRDLHQRLLSIFGQLKELVLPSEADVDRKVAEAFDALGVAVVNVDFSFEAARSSFLKIIRKEAPSEGSQQFKDGVLWADCVSLLRRDDVVLVSGDKAFYEGKDPSKGLASTLAKEVAGTGRTITLVPSLSELLLSIKSKVVIDDDVLAEAYMGMAHQSVDEVLRRAGFRLAQRISLDSELYATEKPDLLFLRFTIAFRCIDSTDGAREDGILKLEGDGFYNPTSATLSELGQLHSSLQFVDIDGQVKKSSNVFARVNAFLGHADVRHVVRFKLN